MAASSKQRIVVCIFFILMSPLTSTTAIQSAEHRGEYCDTEIFRAECQEGWIILLTSAWYGRMRMGRCVQLYLGHMGCKKDVLVTADRRCSGKRICEIRIPDAEFEGFKPCNKELKTYLEASYVCIKAETATSDDCKSSNELKVSSTSGFLASIVTSDTPSCDGLSHPWVIAGLHGQRINLTFYDFALDRNAILHGASTASVIPFVTSPSSSSSSSSSCTRYGMLEDGGSLMYEICGSHERTRHLYLSYTHLVKVWMTAGSAPTDLKRFAIQYNVIGCADPSDASPHFWFRRKFQPPANKRHPLSSTSNLSFSSSSSSSSPWKAPVLPSSLALLPYSYRLRLEVKEVGTWGCHQSGEVVESQCDLEKSRWSHQHVNCSSASLTTEVQLGQEVDLLLRHSNKLSRDKVAGGKSLLSNKMFLIIIVAGVSFIFIFASLVYVIFRVKKRKRSLKQKQRHSVLVQESLNESSTSTTSRDGHHPHHHHHHHHALADNFGRQASGTFHLANKAEIKPLINQSVSSGQANYRQVSVQQGQHDRFWETEQGVYRAEGGPPPPPPSISSGGALARGPTPQQQPQQQQQQQILPPYCHRTTPSLCQQLHRLSTTSVGQNPYHTLRQVPDRRQHKNVTWCPALHESDKLPVLHEEMMPEVSRFSIATATLPRTGHRAPLSIFSARDHVTLGPPCADRLQTGSVDATDVRSSGGDRPMRSVDPLLYDQSNPTPNLGHEFVSPSISGTASPSNSHLAKKTLLTDV